MIIPYLGTMYQLAEHGLINPKTKKMTGDAQVSRHLRYIGSLAAEQLTQEYPDYGLILILGSEPVRLNPPLYNGDGEIILVTHNERGVVVTYGLDSRRAGDVETWAWGDRRISTLAIYFLHMLRQK